MINKVKLSWNDFKTLIQGSEGMDWVYRGQASEEWPLESTLARVTPENYITASHYHNVLTIASSDKRVKNHSILQNLALPIENPMKIRFLVANEEHQAEMQLLFDLMICLRHLGFPSPILDWTRDPWIAAFFAASNTQEKECMAIFRIRTPLPNRFEPFNRRVIMPDIDFNKHPRHLNQQSRYTLVVEHDHHDVVSAPEKRQGPRYFLGEYDRLDQAGMEITKYIITDSKDNRLEILRELYDQGINFSAIYGDTDLSENTVLKDIAINAIFLKRATPGMCDSSYQAKDLIL